MGKSLGAGERARWGGVRRGRAAEERQAREGRRGSFAEFLRSRVRFLSRPHSRK